MEHYGLKRALQYGMHITNINMSAPLFFSERNCDGLKTETEDKVQSLVNNHKAKVSKK